MNKTIKIILFFLFWALSFVAVITAQEYPSGNARIDLLASGGYQFPKKGLGKLDWEDYRFGKQKVKALTVLCFVNFIDGVVEGYEFDGRTSFERIWGVQPYSYFGSLSHDSDWTWFEKLKQSQVDFYHTADDLRKWGYMTGGYMLGRASVKNTRKVHMFYDLGISFIIGGIFKSVGMHWVRGQRLF